MTTPWEAGGDSPHQSASLTASPRGSQGALFFPFPHTATVGALFSRFRKWRRRATAGRPYGRVFFPFPHTAAAGGYAFPWGKVAFAVSRKANDG